MKTDITSSISTYSPPTAKKEPKQLTMHGDTRIDQYHWLNNREDPAVIDYLNAENEYREQIMAPTEDYQESLYQELIGRIKQTDMSVPYFFNGYYYLTRYEEGDEYPYYSRKRESLDAEEEVMLNANELAKDYEYYQVGGRAVSPDNTILAYGEDTLSRRIYTIKFKSLVNGEYLSDVIENTTGSVVWANDNTTVFYTRKDESLRAFQIYRHTLGSDPDTDVLIYHETDETFSTYVYKTKSQRYIIIGSYATLTSEFRIIDANKPMDPFRIFSARERKHEHDISHYDGHFYIVTNWNAKNFRLMKTPENQTAKQHWEEVIPHREDVLLEDVDIFKNFMVVSERINGVTQLRIIPFDGSDEHYIAFPEPAFTAYTSINPEFDTEMLRIGYTSMTTPNSTFDYNMATQEMVLRKQQEVQGEFSPDLYQSERLLITARDGSAIPVSIVYKKGYEKNGRNPLLLYGYGSYGYSMDPYFSSSRLSLLNRGFAFAIAHIRGGEEMGRYWYEEGKLLNKMNTFTDFIDCAEELVNREYTSKEQLYAMGGSAGGLLIGAVINMRPDLFRGVIAAVPFVDVVTTMLDETIPLTTGEFDEWGNPKDKEYYEYMLSYSPYDNVEAKDYPAMLVTTGLHDSQVQYWEPAKWVAKLRAHRTDHNPLLMYCNMSTGHGGASGRFQAFRETAMEYTFLLDLAGKIDLAN